MLVNHSRDWMARRGRLESVTWCSTRGSGDKVDTLLNGVFREELSQREIQASGGAYAPGDCWFCLPAVLLPNGPPKPGDFLVDLGAAKFTVVETTARLRDGSGQYQEYRLRGRNKVIAFDLADVLSIETPSITLDASGAEIKGRWAALYSGLRAKVVKNLDEQADLLAIRGMRGSYTVLLETEVAVTNKERIPWAEAPSGYLEIVRYHPAAAVDAIPVIDCAAMP